MPVTRHPPHRSQRAELPHWAPTSGAVAQALTACRMFATAKALVRTGIKKEHGLIDRYELRKHVFLRLYGQDFGETEQAKILDSWRLCSY